MVLLKNQEPSCPRTFPCVSPVLHRLCPEPSHGAQHRAGAALLRPSISLAHLCALVPGLSVLPPRTDSPSRAAVGPLPPSDRVFETSPVKQPLGILLCLWVFVANALSTLMLILTVTEGGT